MVEFGRRHGRGQFVESGGDNLAATFSPELSDLTIYVCKELQCEQRARDLCLAV